MAERSTWDVDAREAVRGRPGPAAAGDRGAEVHRRVDEVIDASLAGHA
jgi:hypothetical protein